MSSGDGACALDGTGLLCSVIGWLPCQDVRGCCLAGSAPVPLWGIKKPLVPGGSRGARAGTGLVSSLRASQVRECGSASRLHPHPQAGLSSNYHGACLNMRDDLSGNFVRSLTYTQVKINIEIKMN